LSLQVIASTTHFGTFWDNIRQMIDTQNVQNIISKNRKPKLMKLYQY